VRDFEEEDEMKRNKFFRGTLLLFFLTTTSSVNASIVSWSYSDDGDRGRVPHIFCLLKEK
jgi:hypothetical protein